MTERERKLIFGSCQTLANNGLLTADAIAELERSICQKNEEEPFPELMTTKEVMEILKCRRQTLYQYCRAGKLEKIKIGRRKIYITKDSLWEFLRGIG